MELEENLRFGHINRIELINIRGFKHLILNLEAREEVRRKMVIIGRNGTGKSTLLRAVALALSPQSDAISLLSPGQGSFVREGREAGTIRVQGIDLIDASEFNIEVRIKGEGRNLSLTRKVDSNKNLLNFFVCGYGAGRSLTGVTSEEQYRQLDSVGS
jgi:predicted ATPase